MCELYNSLEPAKKHSIAEDLDRTPNEVMYTTVLCTYCSTLSTGGKETGGPSYTLCILAVHSQTYSSMNRPTYNTHKADLRVLLYILDYMDYVCHLLVCILLCLLLFPL